MIPVVFAYLMLTAFLAVAYYAGYRHGRTDAVEHGYHWACPDCTYTCSARSVDDALTAVEEHNQKEHRERETP